MKNIKHNAVIVLRIVSQLLLVLFVIYWLMGEYQGKKKFLKEELERGFIIAERMMIDSVLNTHLIEPILHDTLKNFDIHISSDSSKFDTIKVIGSFNQGNPRDRRRMSFFSFSSDSLNLNDSVNLRSSFIRDSSNSYLYSGVRLFVNQLGRIDHNPFSRGSFIRANADTLILQQSFREFLQKYDDGLRADWISKKDTANNSVKGILLMGRIFEDEFLADVTNYKAYLFRAIFSQILFALFLLIVTFTTFRISYLNTKKQQKLLQIKNEFISNITHELKTPVTTVKVALESLIEFEMNKNPKVVQEYLEMSVLELNRLDTLVNKVLNNSMLEDGKEMFVREEADLKVIIKEVITSQQYRIHKDEAGIVFTTELSSAITMIDKVHIQGVLINLIDNSLKYGGSKVQVEVNLFQKSNDFIVCVKDNGPCIPEEYLNKVFDKFFRVPSNNRHNVKGYGLGLHYAKQVMDHHHGKIEVRNLPEGGCEFALTIPIIEI